MRENKNIKTSKIRRINRKNKNKDKDLLEKKDFNKSSFNNKSFKKDAQNINKYRNIILFIFFITLAIYLILRFTLANPGKQINILAADFDGRLQNINIAEKIETGENGKYITLPEKINGFYVKEYYLTLKEEVLNNPNSINEDTTSLKTTKLLKPNEKYILNEEDLKNKNIDLKVKYLNKELENNYIYKKVLIQNKKAKQDKKEENIEAIFSGYFKENIGLNIFKIDLEKLQNEENLEDEKNVEDVKKSNLEYIKNIYNLNLSEEDFINKKNELLNLKNGLDENLDSSLNVDSNKTYKILDLVIFEKNNIESEKEKLITIEEYTKSLSFDPEIEFKLNSKFIGKENINENVKESFNLVKKLKEEKINTDNKNTLKIEDLNLEKSLNEENENREIYLSFKNEDILDAKYYLVEEKNTDENSDRSALEISPEEVPEALRAVNLDVPGDLYNERMTGDIWNGEYSDRFFYGDGTKERPYLIKDAKDFAKLSRDNSYGQSFEGIYFQLVRDLDFGGAYFKPIGADGNPFLGNIDGNGRSIRNINLEIATEYFVRYGKTNIGLFTELGSGQSVQEIKNLNLDNINITIDRNTNINNTRELMIGTLAGSVNKNVNISGISIINSKIEENSRNNGIDYRFKLFIGGAFGEIKSGAKIESIAVDIKIDSLSSSSNMNYFKYGSVGGIVGRIEGEMADVPTKTFTKGEIKAGAMIGPVFGSIIYQNAQDPNILWQGGNYSSKTLDNRYGVLRINDKLFYNNIKTGNSDARISNYYRSIGYYQGINKGSFVYDKQSNIDYLNNKDALFDTINENYIVKPKNNTYIEEPLIDRFKISVERNYPLNILEVDWFEEDRFKTKTNGESLYKLEKLNFDSDIKISAVYKDNKGHFGYQEVIKPRIYVDFKINVDRSKNQAEVTMEGSALRYISRDEFTYEWKKEEISGKLELIEKNNKNTFKVENTEEALKKYDYEVNITHSKYSNLSGNLKFSFVDRNVIYVSEDYGSYYNDGRSPDRPVDTFQNAYTKLEYNKSKYENIVVVMGRYRGQDAYNSNANIFSKKAYVTGKYKENEYNGRLSLATQDNSDEYKYLYDDTVFSNITFDGRIRVRSWWSYQENPKQLYLYVQGNNLDIEENVRMENYERSNTNQGLISNNAPAVHIFAGWQRYNYSRLPKVSPVINIKSGVYGRIILGGSPGTNATENMVNETSRNFTGSSKEDSFKPTVNIDIKDGNNKGGYDYDINLLVGGTAAGNTYANVTHNILNGKIGRVLGASIGDSSTVLYNWNFPINTYIGTVDLNLKGGEIDEVFGGSLGRNMGAINGGRNRQLSDSYFYGDININVEGTRINGNIYGAGAGGVAGYHENSSDEYKRYGKGIETNVNINLKKGLVLGNIYGGGYGYTNYLTESTLTHDAGALYGNSYINISENVDLRGDIYAAGRGQAFRSKPNIAQMVGNTYINIKGNPNITGKIFGGGEGVRGYLEIAKLIGNSNILISPENTFSTSAIFFSGGNNARIKGNTNINLKSGNILNQIYGGGNFADIDGETNVILEGGSAENVFGSGNNGKTNNTNIYLKNGNINNIFGGANREGGQSTNITLEGGQGQNVYGGSNFSGNIKNTKITLLNGNFNNIFGGNNEGGKSENTNIFLKGGKSQNVYGGSNRTDAGNTNIYSEGGEVLNIYGGSNIEGNVANSKIILNSEDEKYKNALVFGGNNEGGLTNTSNISMLRGYIKSIYGGSNKTDIKKSNVEVKHGTIMQDVYGGSNKKGTAENTNVNILGGIIKNVYGGNNEGGSTILSNVEIKGGNIENVYGGGNKAETTNTNLKMESGIVENVFGGGNVAKILEDTNVEIKGGDILKDVYGGGNEGLVEKNTYIDLRDVRITGSAYAGGKGVAALVKESSNININSGTIVGDDNSKAPHFGSVFGSGNAASTGFNGNNNGSRSVVNIVGGKIYGNVYGSANTSVVYGKSNLNIGINAAKTKNITNLKKGDIYIKGTIFGGGEANAEGSENYDYSFISVTDSIDINIDGTLHENFDTEGSIFGSGNASSSSGHSKIYIKNYGKPERPGKNISIQRANEAVLENTHIALRGTTDRTNEYSNENFSISRIDHLKLSKSSSMYLEYGANLLKEYSSLVDSGENSEGNIAKVTIDENGNKTLNVDNRIYMFEGRNLNIATNESVTAYGKVNGMTFFGLYNNKVNPVSSAAIYGREIENGSVVTNPGTFSYNAYVLAAHKENHDIKKDGFYTNYNKNGTIKVDYVGVTPEDELYYIWLVGDALDVTTYEVTLTASKYATLGTYELPLIGFSKANTKYSVAGFSAGLSKGVTLKDQIDIPVIANEEKDANNNFGLKIKPSRTGWKTRGETNFYVNNDSTAFYKGNTTFSSEDKPVTPSMLLYLYHSQNISEEKALGEATVRYQVLEPVDDLNYNVRYIDIKITMLTALYQDYFYDTAIAPGEEFDLFTTTETNITDKSKFSSYFSLVIENFSNTDYEKNFYDLNRKLISRDKNEKPLVFKENTKITMIDRVLNETYYYNVTKEDERNGKYKYLLSDFTLMGTDSKKYDEKRAINRYIDKNKNLVFENYIFHVDFENANIDKNYIDSTFLLELQTKEEDTLIGVLGVSRDKAKYSVYLNKNSNITASGNINPTKIYIGEEASLNILNEYSQVIIDTKRISDTKYFDKQMGIKLSFIDSQNNKVPLDSLIGIEFELDGKTYTPSIDGSTRIKISDNVSNTLSKLKINTSKNKIMATGKYNIEVEPFGSPDGMYYGDLVLENINIPVEIINMKYGLDVKIDGKMQIINKDTGNTENKDNLITVKTKYRSELVDPKLSIHLERRNYDTIYDKSYEKIDLKEYINEDLGEFNQKEKIYKYDLGPGKEKEISKNYTLKKNIKSGTYKVVITLYDEAKEIGKAFDYIVIK